MWINLKVTLVIHEVLFLILTELNEQRNKICIPNKYLAIWQTKQDNETVFKNVTKEMLYINSNLIVVHSQYY